MKKNFLYKVKKDMFIDCLLHCIGCAHQNEGPMLSIPGGGPYQTAHMI